MRILQIVHNFLPKHISGVEVYTENLTQKLSVEHEVALLFAEVVPDAPNYALRRGRRGKVSTYEVVNNQHLRSFEETYRNTAVDRRLDEVLDEFRPNVVHVQHLMNLSIDTIRVIQRRGIPVVMTLHDHWLECANGGQRYHPRLGRCDTLDARRCGACTSHMNGAALGARGFLRRKVALGENANALDLTTLEPRVSTPNPAFVYRDRYLLDGTPSPTFVAQPPSTLSFNVETECGGRFASALTLHPDTFEREGGGVRFLIRIDGDVCCDETLDPKQRAEDRRPLRVEVTLPPGHCQIELETQAAPEGRADYCTAGWVEPRIIAEQGVSEPVSNPLLRPLRKLARLASHIPRSQQTRRIEKRWAAMREMSELVDLFISPSRYLHDKFEDFGIAKDKLLHCDYGFATESFEKRSDLPEIARRYAFIGSLVPHKGVHVLINAFNRMPADAHLDICGSHDYDPPYTRSLIRLATHPGIRFVGAIPPKRIAAFQQNIDCQIVPSIWHENSPLTIHEGFLSGIPVLVSNLGGSRELVRDGGGLTYEADDPNDLLRTLRRLYDEPGLARDLASSAPDVKPMDDHALELSAIYERLRTTTDRGSLRGN